MGDLIKISFRSYHTLHKWILGRRCDETTQQYYDGMRAWFHQEKPVIRIYDYGEGASDIVDIQMEFDLEEGRDQVFLMTLVTSKDLDPNALYMCDAPDPFFSGAIIWPREKLDSGAILEAIRSWSKKWWPDFEVEYVFAPVAETLDYEWKEDNFTHLCNVTVKNQGQEITLKPWALGVGCMAVEVQPQIILLVGLPISQLPNLERLWPGMLECYDLLIP